MRAYDWIHRLCILIACAFIASTALAQAAMPGLRAAFDAAWQRSPQARMLEARRDEMQAGREAAQTWTAGAPTIGLAQRSDRWTEQNGVRETEVSLSAPIWWPGQKSTRQALAQFSAEDLEAQIVQARLALAGELRERLWAVAAARAALAEAQDHQTHLDALADEVMRRVNAGDLARTDGMLARQEVLAAKAASAAAQAKVQEAVARYRTLTGDPDMPAPDPEPLGQAAQAPHPRILATHAALHSARAALDVVNETRSDPPTIGVAMRRERDRPANPASHSVSIGVQIPLGTAARNRPLESAARTKIEAAAAEAKQAEAMVHADVEIARQQLAATEQALEAAALRTALMRDHTRLIEKAFRLGERGLADLLRSQALSHEAAMAERQQRVAAGLAHARLNQALGIMP